MTVQILLSTYNGETYLREQIESLLLLDNAASVKILVRDDGSTDGTLAILRSYRDRGLLSLIEGENLGLNRSVYALIAARDRTADAFSFADQDDVWLPDKLSRAVTALSEVPSGVPALYAACSSITDENLVPKGETLFPRRQVGFYNAMVQNVCIGHTLVMNAALAALYEGGYHEDIFVFDYWAYLLASVAGKILFDDEKTTLYRQHGSNQIGYRPGKLGTLRMRARRVLAGKSYRNAAQLSAFLEVYGDRIPAPYKKEAEDFFASERNFFTRFAYLFRTKAYRQTHFDSFVFRVMYLFGRYKIKKETKQ